MLLLASFAFADIAPPDGIRYVDYQVVVTGIAGDQALVVFPWSTSNGRPMAETAEVKNDRPLSFGRRIMGTPKFYVVNGAEFAMDPLTFDVEAKGTKCNVHPKPRFTASKKENTDVIVDRFTVVKLDEGACELKQESDKLPAAVKRKMKKGLCSSVPLPTAAGALLLVLAGLRRRH